MTRIMFIGDLHWRDKNPPHRIDDYKQDIENCFIESLHMASRANCSAVVLLGDLFDRYEPAGFIRNRVAEICAGIIDIDKPVSKWPFPIYSLIGNHDISGTPETIRRTGIYSVALAGVIIPSDGDDYKIRDMPIHVVHWINDIEFMDYSDVDARILAMHAYILPDDNDFPGKHIKISDFKVHPNVKMVICGHYHPGYDPVIRDDGVIFCNPGSICRMSAIRNNIERKIQVMIVEMDEDKDWTISKYKNFNLKSAQPGNKIFDLLGADKIKKEKLQRREFLEVIDHIREEALVEISDNPLEDIKNWCEKMGAGEIVTQIIESEWQEMLAEQK